MTCPKCGAAMRSYERNGVTIDQCDGCRGIFLDRGELERLVDAEGAYYAPARGAAPRDARSEERDRGAHGDRDRRDSGHGSGEQRRRGFLGDLFG